MYLILGCRFYSSAEVERSFSILNCVKTYRRNRMKNPLLNKLLRIKSMFNKEDFSDTDFIDKINKD